MGDIHGAYRALLQCLERAGFERTEDVLVQLGDVVDGYGEVFECVEELLRIPKLIAIRGNHDDWLREFIETGYHPVGWNYGGATTARSYSSHAGRSDKLKFTGKGYKTPLNPKDIPAHHRAFFQGQRFYYIDENNVCYVHGGFDRWREFKQQRPEIYYWDRQLWTGAFKWEVSGKDASQFRMATRFKDIFIGHTSTLQWRRDRPIRAANVYNLDTGAGSAGRLTIMEAGSKRFWQSDPVGELYSKSGHFNVDRRASRCAERLV